MSNRRDFLRALALGSGAVLIGNGWFKKGRGLIQPPIWPVGIIDATFAVDVQDFNGEWSVLDPTAYTVSRLERGGYSFNLGLSGSPLDTYRYIRPRILGPTLIRPSWVGGSR